ncbi:cell division cycle and apoptosis regulator protein 1-like [Uloborus diversus]|uniref:cell division cycle and apoptosis regulator protein 1-like n=1 Tax=Uloborus diversus TaxID=327109 RepID=UPI0024098457|nr:cell division cycle and apoptosis regulator protein 1-like [Uloborus diversus]
MPKTGERVLVEATYNPSMPFKWTATRIQVLPNQVVQVNVQPTNNTRPQLLQQQQRTQPLGLPPQGVNPLSLAANQPAFSTVGQLMESLGQQQQRLNIQQNNQHNWIQEVDYGEVIDGKMSRMNQLGRRQHSPPRRERDLRRERYRDRYSPPPPRKRSRSPPPRRPSRSPPPRRRPRIIPRYTVQIPKISLDLKIGNVMELRKRYSNLYIPSDFCGVNFLWQEAFPPHRPFSMDHPCTFHIIGKDAEPVFENDAVLDAPDADYSYSAKVMLMSSPALGEIFHKSCSLAEDGEDSRENHVHPARLLQFLVGLRGKNETVAIGGPWSPSLDGPDPDKDPSTLVRTAIRTCRALTGIDLGKCIQWYRFAEIYYRRGESWSSKGRVETVVLFVPDVWSCLPTRIEWDDMSRKKANWKLDAADVQAQVNDIKRELESKNLGAKGLKSQLILRLTQALQSEAEKEMADKSSGPEPDDADEENADENKKKEKEEEKKTREEKEKTNDKRNLPENPAIIVQPSKTAKNRKFDCAIMSLSLLLDYRQEDNKEHSFEVSLFAELFNEMMMRDFGFRIYRALVEAPEVKDDDKDKRKSDKKDDKRERKDLKDMDYRKDDADSDKDDDDSEDDDGDADEKRDKDRKKRRKKKSQMLTHDPYLLLSFVYYDQTHCGYLLDKDLEEIFYMLGLMLTRAQVRKLIQKVCKREVLRYRRLTDGPSDSEKTGKSDSGKINLESLASGNKKYIPELRRSNSKGGEESSLVSCRGSLVDVGKLVDRLELSEKGRLDAEDKIRAQLSELERLQEEVSARERQQQKLAADLEDRRQRLRAAEDELKRARQEAERCQRALGAIRDGLQTTLGVAEGALGKRARPSRGGEAEAPRVKREAEEAKSEPNGDGGVKSDGNGDGGVKSDGNGDGGVKSDGNGDGGVKSDRNGDGGVKSDRNGDGGVKSDRNGDGGVKSDRNGEDRAKRARKDSPPREKEEEATANGEK